MKIHHTHWKTPDRFRCGLKRRPIPEDATEMCKRCEDLRFIDQRRDEEEGERLIEAGVLEPNMGPNRRWNEY